MSNSVSVRARIPTRDSSSLAQDGGRVTVKSTGKGHSWNPVISLSFMGPGGGGEVYVTASDLEDAIQAARKGDTRE